MKFNDRTMALLGVPDLPERAFIRKAGGGIIPQGGGSAPSASSTSTTALPEWALGYAQDTLAKQAALSDRPYEAYGAPRIQGFTPMQEQARQAAASMDAGPAGFSQGISAYMSPYMQNVVDIQKREAQRQSDIMGQQQQAQAAQAGAFGGSRDAIMRAERERNLGQQMGDIQARGSQAAFDQAANQFRQGITQGMDVNRLQSAYGAQQQAMGQQGLNLAYQDWQNQRDYPQQQLSNMANMMRGIPIGSTTTGYQTGTTGSPSFLQTLGSLGTAAYGLKQFFADGGSVDSQQNIEAIVHKLSDQQLDQAEQAAKARGDEVQLEAIQMEKAARASMDRGLASIPVDMDKMLPTEESMARGGIVAFAGGGMDTDEFGYNPNASFSSDTGANASLPEPAPLSPEDMRSSVIRQMYERLMKPESEYVPPTQEQADAAYDRYIKRAKELAGPSQYEQERENIKRLQEENATNLKHGKGLAALQAAAAMVQGNNPIRGITAGLGEFGKAYSGIAQATQAENRALQSMRFNLADAERKERMGLHRDANEAMRLAETDKRNAIAARQAADRARRTDLASLITATKPEKEPNVNVDNRIINDNIEFRMGSEKPRPGETPEMQRKRIAAEEGNKVLAAKQQRVSVADWGPTRTGIEGEKAEARKAEASTRTNAAINAMVEKTKFQDAGYTKALAEGDDAGKEAAKNRMYDAIAQRQGTPTPARGPNAPQPPAVVKPTEDQFKAKWATLKSGESTIGPDGKTYTKR